MPLVTVKTKFQVTIPQAVRAKLGIEEGDLLEAEVENGRIVLTPKVVLDRHPAIDAALSGALEEVKRGETIGPFETVGELREYLERHQPT